MKRKSGLIGLVVLTGGALLTFAGSASFSPVEPGALSTEQVAGMALFPGAIVGDTRYGVTFSGTADGAIPGWWTVTVNYAPPQADGGMVNTITGGKWQVSMIENAIYRGSLYGDVEEGTITRDETGTYADIEALLSITGGTGRYAGASGTARVTNSRSSHVTFPPSISGQILLRYQLSHQAKSGPLARSLPWEGLEPFFVTRGN